MNLRIVHEIAARHVERFFMAGILLIAAGAVVGSRGAAVTLVTAGSLTILGTAASVILGDAAYGEWASLTEPRYRFRPRGVLWQAWRTAQYAMRRGRYSWEKDLPRHIVVCGVPRSGTTLLYAMLRSCVDDSQSWRDEMCGLDPRVVTAKRATYVISKDPYDVFNIPRLRRVLHNVRFIVTWREPKAVLASSLHGKYWVSPEDYIRWMKAIQGNFPAPDCALVTFDRILRHTDRVEEDLKAWLGFETRAAFKEFYKVAPDEDRDQPHVRPLDLAVEEKWKKPENRAHVEKAFAEYPILAEYEAWKP